MLLAVKTLDAALPNGPVTAVLAPPGKLARGPDPGAGVAKVTVTPLTGWPAASLTVATSRLANAVLTRVL